MPRPSGLSLAAGRRIRNVRTDGGLSIDRLARRAGLDPALLGGIEDGSARPTVGALLRIAKALNVPVMNLVVDGDGTTKRAKPGELDGEIERLGRSIATLPEEVGNKLRAVEMAAVMHAVALTGGNLSAASRVLGLERKALIRRWEHVQRAAKRRGAKGKRR